MLADIFFPMPNGVNPAGNFFVGIANIVIAINLLFQLLTPSITIAYFIFFAERENRLQIPRNLVIPGVAVFGPGAALLLMLIFGMWWSFLLNIAYCIAGSAAMHFIVVPKSRELYASGAMTKLEDRLKTHVVALVGEQLPSTAQFSLGPKFDASTQEPLSSATPFLACVFGIIGFSLPFLTQLGEPFATILVLSGVFFFSWAIPIAVHAILNDPHMHNYVRVPLLAGLIGYWGSFTMQTGILFIPALLYAGGYFYWWQKNHPYLTMKLVHARVTALRESTTVISTADFLAEFRLRYRERWEHEPSQPIMQAAHALYKTEAVTELPDVPPLPPFQPVYSYEQDISGKLSRLEEQLRAIPERNEAVIQSITTALNAYTEATVRALKTYAEAIQDYETPSVLTVAVWDVMDDLPRMVEEFGASMPADGPIRELYRGSIELISSTLLPKTEFERGARIKPTEYPQHARS